MSPFLMEEVADGAHGVHADMDGAGLMDGAMIGMTSGVMHYL